MAIPKAAQKMAEDADAALDEAMAAETPSPEVVSAEEDFEASEQTPAEVPETPEDPLFETSPEESEDAPSPEDTADDGVDYEQMYSSLRGKYDAEVPRLHQEVSRLGGMVEALNTSPETPSEAADDSDGFLRHLRDEEIEDYGTEVLDIQARMAQGVSEDVVDARVGEFEDRLAALESDRLQTAAELFWERADRAYPGARAVNDTDPLWHEFLSKADPLSGITYRELGENALTTGDAERLVGLLQKFKPVKMSETARKKGSVKPRIASGTTVQTQESLPGTIKTSTIEQFYRDRVRGVYTGKEDLAKKREDAIDLAVEEGRVVDD